MNILVPEKLSALEKQHNMQLLLAVESGSRAWGFASQDSDYDIRFLYQRPMQDYLHNLPHDEPKDWTSLDNFFRQRLGLNE